MRETQTPVETPVTAPEITSVLKRLEGIAKKGGEEIVEALSELIVGCPDVEFVTSPWNEQYLDEAKDRAKEKMGLKSAAAVKSTLISIPDEVRSDELENYLADELGFELQSEGAGTVEYFGNIDPKALRERLEGEFNKRIVDKIAILSAQDLDEAKDRAKDRAKEKMGLKSEAELSSELLPVVEEAVKTSVGWSENKPFILSDWLDNIIHDLDQHLSEKYADKVPEDQWDEFVKTVADKAYPLMREKLGLPKTSSVEIQTGMKKLSEKVKDFATYRTALERRRQAEDSLFQLKEYERLLKQTKGVEGDTPESFKERMEQVGKIETMLSSEITEWKKLEKYAAKDSYDYKGYNIYPRTDGGWEVDWGITGRKFPTKEDAERFVDELVSEKKESSQKSGVTEEPACVCGHEAKDHYQYGPEGGCQKCSCSGYKPEEKSL
jgi:hypothetical protein